MERLQEQIVEPIEVLPHERVQQFTAEQIVHMPVPQTQEQSAVTDAVEVVDSFMTTHNTSSTSTNRDRLDELAGMLDSCLAQFRFHGMLLLSARCPRPPGRR